MDKIGINAYIIRKYIIVKNLKNGKMSWFIFHLKKATGDEHQSEYTRKYVIFKLEMKWNFKF